MLVSQRRVPDTLIDASTLTCLYTITKEIGLLATGMPADARAMVSRARQEAAEFRYQFGYPITVELLGRRLANLNQLCTQQAAMRPYGVTVSLIGMDLSDNGVLTPQLYKCDPAGFYTSYAGTATGPKATDATTNLEKKAISIITDDGSEMYHFGVTVEETIISAIKTLAEVVGQDFKATDIEIGLVSIADPAFKTLGVQDVDAILTKLAESD